MQFPNAVTGVNKIYTAEILTIIAAVIGVIAAILGVVGAAAELDGSIAGAAILLIVFAILMIVAFIVNITGVSSAAKDDTGFKNALIALVVGILANIVISAFSNNEIITGIGNFITKVTEFLSSYFICTGIINLSERLNDAAVGDKGKRVRSLLMILFLVSAVLSLLSASFKSNDTLMTIAAVISIISSIVSIVAYFMYLGLLKKAKKMLEQ